MTYDDHEISNVVFLALDIWREASNQPDDARAAVGQSVLTRVHHPGWWGDGVMAVLFKKAQYSSLTHPGDPNLVRWPLETDQSWWDCLRIAELVLDGDAPNPCPGADSYWSGNVTPYWGRSARVCGKVGDFTFVAVERDWEADHVQ